MTAPLAASERALLPAHMQHPEAVRYHSDTFDNHEAVQDAIDDARAWIAKNSNTRKAA